MEATLMLSPDQAAYLVNIGLVTLVSAGTLTVQDMTEEEFNAEIQKQKEAAQAEGDAGTPSPAFLEVDTNTTKH